MGSSQVNKAFDTREIALHGLLAFFFDWHVPLEGKMNRLVQLGYNEYKMFHFLYV